MAQENTAVNALIASAQNRRLEPLDEADDLFVDASARAARAVAAKASASMPVVPTPTAPPVPVPVPSPTARSNGRQTVLGRPASLPPPFRPSGSIAAVDAQGTPVPQVLPGTVVEEEQTKPYDMLEEGELTPLPPPMVPQTEPIERTPLPTALKNLSRTATGEEDAWFDKSVPIDHVESTYVGPEDDVRGARKSQAVWWIGGAFALGIGLALLLFWPSGGHPAKAPATAPTAASVAPPAAAPTQAPAVAPATPPAAPAIAPIADPAAAAPAAVAEEPAVTAVDPAAAAPAVEPTTAEEPTPTVEPIAPAAPAAGAVTIKFDSVPSGATIVLVQDGDAIPLGVGPVEREIDPSRHNEVMFTLAGYASVILPVDTSLTNVTARLGASGSKPSPAVAPTPAPEPAVARTEPTPAAPKAAKATPKATPKATAPKAAAPKAVAAKKAPKETPAPAAAKKRTAAAAPSDGGGVLMIASKPPCDIVVDGKKTGLTTPQRALSLSPGKHQVTLVNREHSIKESFSVTIKAGASVRVIKDLTSKM